MSYTVEIEDFSAEMLPRATAIMATHFPPGDRLLTEAYHDWLCLQNPFGTAKVVIVRHGDDWAGFMALVPVRLARGSESLRACFVVNVLVDPAHQGQSLFGRMIAVAVEWARAEGVVLMGHPNAAANPFWQRKRMHFQEELQPAVALPKFWTGGLRARKAKSRADLAKAGEALAAVVAQSPCWKVAATPEFLAWRFLDHPDNRYVIQIVFESGNPVGVQVSKRMKPGVHLLIDQFVPSALSSIANCLLPAFTVQFLPGELLAGRKGRGLQALRFWKKRVPVFATNFGERIAADDAAEPLLSASDF